MPFIHPAALEYELRRWTRLDARLFIKSDWRRYVKAGSDAATVFARYEIKYRPDQLRHPKGVPEGGEFADEGRGRGRAGQTRGDGSAVELSAQRRRTPGPTDGTPAQAARLAVVEARAKDAIARVRQYDRNWKPTPSFSETFEGKIASVQAEAQEAEARLRALASVGIGPGPYARESISAGPTITTADRVDLNRLFDLYGCHTCGSRDAGTLSGNAVGDHQPPSAFYWLSIERRLYPQCLSCSLRQGGWANVLKGHR